MTPPCSSQWHDAVISGSVCGPSSARLGDGLSLIPQICMEVRVSQLSFASHNDIERDDHVAVVRIGNSELWMRRWRVEGRQVNLFWGVRL